MARKPQTGPEPEPKIFNSAEEITRGAEKLRRRMEDVRALDVIDTVDNHTGKDKVVASAIIDTIRDVFGPNSPEAIEHTFIHFWPRYNSGEDARTVFERGKVQTLNLLEGLIALLNEKLRDLEVEASPSTYIDKLQLHPRIADVSIDLFVDGHHFEAVFAASKALVNFVKERSGKHDLDGAALMRTVFSRNNPILRFNGLRDQTELDEQEGMMHLFEGAVLGIRNPGGHSFPEGTEQRAIEYISLLSLLAYRVQEAKKAPKA
jgi:uncharacterized protein (TIGR02391 family)